MNKHDPNLISTHLSRPKLCWLLKSDFKVSFCVTSNVTRSKEVESRVTEAHQRGWETSMLWFFCSTGLKTWRLKLNEDTIWCHSRSGLLPREDHFILTHIIYFQLRAWIPPIRSEVVAELWQHYFEGGNVQRMNFEWDGALIHSA